MRATNFSQLPHANGVELRLLRSPGTFYACFGLREGLSLNDLACKAITAYAPGRHFRVCLFDQSSLSFRTQL